LYSAISETVQILIANAVSPSPSHEVSLNRLVEQAFQLTDAEREIIENSLPARDPIAILNGTADVYSKSVE
jgi:hypothetical protein